MADVLETLSRSDRDIVARKTARLRELATQAAECVLEMGRELHDLRVLFGEQRFKLYLGQEFSWSVATAYRYIALYKWFRDRPTVDYRTIAVSAMHLLVAPSTPAAAVQELTEIASREPVAKETAVGIVALHQPDDADEPLVATGRNHSHGENGRSDESAADPGLTAEQEQELLELEEEEQADDLLRKTIQHLQGALKTGTACGVLRRPILIVLESLLGKVQATLKRREKHSYHEYRKPKRTRAG